MVLRVFCGFPVDSSSLVKCTFRWNFLLHQQLCRSKRPLLSLSTKSLIFLWIFELIRTKEIYYYIEDHNQYLFWTQLKTLKPIRQNRWVLECSISCEKPSYKWLIILMFFTSHIPQEISKIVMFWLNYDVHKKRQIIPLK